MLCNTSFNSYMNFIESHYVRDELQAPDGLFSDHNDLQAMITSIMTILLLYMCSMVCLSDVEW